LFFEYILIFKYIFFCFLLAFLLFFISFFLVIQTPNPEKVSVYECGFNPYEDSRGKFEVRFYIVAILFIIFDIEIAFLLP
jgi:NADH-quinone oxidoreductase subunit A